MRKSPRRAVLDDAGRTYALGREREDLEAERRRLDERIHSVEQKLAEAMKKFESSFEKAVEMGRDCRDGHAAAGPATADQAITPGKLPHRVLSRMRSPNGARLGSTTPIPKLIERARRASVRGSMPGS